MQAFMLTIHRYCGLASLAFLAIAAITGCILTVRGPLDRSLNADLFSAPSATATTPEMTVAAVTRFERAYPDFQVTSFPLNVPSGETIPVQVSARPGGAEPEADQWFLDPADGAVVGQRSTSAGFDRRQFVAGVAELHFDLMAGTFGRYLLGGIAVLWLFSNIAGLYLTFPQKGDFWRGWWRNWQFRRSSKLPRLLLDLHRSTGLWLLPFLMILAFTSAALNFFGEAYAPAVTAMAPLEHDLFDDPVPFPDGATPSLGFADALGAARNHAEKTGLEWKPATMLYLPEWNFHGVKFSEDGVLDYRRLGPVDYYFDAATGEYRHQVDPYSDSMGLVMIRVVYPLHSGEIFGTLTVILVFILGLATLGQSATGLYVWWKKRKSRVAARRARTLRAGRSVA